MAGELVVSTINGAGFDGGNVVYNPEFTINQRGAASRTATSSAYNFDRWYYDGTNLLQGIEGNNLRAGTYVISWEGSSTAAFSLNTAAAGSQGGQSYTSVTNGGTITIASVGSNNLWIRFTSDLTNLTKVKVSPGSQSSDFVARPYGTELQLCMRYYYQLRPQTNTALFFPFCLLFVEDAGADAIRGTLNTFLQMRATPTVTNTGNFRFYAGNGPQNTGTTVIASAEPDSPSVVIKFSGNVSGITTTAGECGNYASNNDATANIKLSAEL